MFKLISKLSLVKLELETWSKTIRDKNATQLRVEPEEILAKLEDFTNADFQRESKRLSSNLSSILEAEEKHVQ